MRTHIASGLLLLIASATPVGAQQATEVNVSETTRRQVATFEGTLRLAIDSAAANLNKRLREAMPERPTMLVFERDTLVNGAWLPEGGAVFHVLIPGIREIDLKIWSLQQLQQRAGPQPSIRPGTQGTVVNNAVVDPDPPTPAPKGPPLTNPDDEYTKFTRIALLDAVLDGALALPIPADKNLTVIANELQDGPPSPFVPRSRTLILQISGEDLLALRQKTISREDALARIKQYRY